MDRLFSLAMRLSAGIDDLCLIGGLAVRVHVGAGSRLTRDVDFVPLTRAAESALIQRLTDMGFVISDAKHWQRAIAPATRDIVDVLRHPIVNPRTFEAASLRDPVTVTSAPNGFLPVVAATDLARLKLLAGRDQDLVDLLLLAAVHPSAKRIAVAAELDELERAVSAGANAARRALVTGELASCAEELLGRAPSPTELATFADFLEQLRQEGL